MSAVQGGHRHGPAQPQALPGGRRTPRGRAAGQGQERSCESSPGPALVPHPSPHTHNHPVGETPHPPLTQEKLCLREGVTPRAGSRPTCPKALFAEAHREARGSHNMPRGPWPTLSSWLRAHTSCYCSEDPENDCIFKNKHNRFGNNFGFTDKLQGQSRGPHSACVSPHSACVSLHASVPAPDLMWLSHRHPFPTPGAHTASTVVFLNKLSLQL